MCDTGADETCSDERLYYPEQKEDNCYCAFEILNLGKYERQHYMA
jgi:hypothetical protein